MFERIGNVIVRGWDFLTGGQSPKNDLMIRGKWHGVTLHESQEAKDRGDAPIWEVAFPNGITDAGIQYLLEVGFRDGDAPDPAQIAPWYAGLIDDSSFTGVAAGDTMASHSGWIEATQYSESDRQTLAFGAVAARAITAQVAFTMSSTKTLRGIFVTSVSTKSDNTGTLWSTALFGTPPTVVSGNVLTCNYSLTD